jgi:hypothetical protein
VSEVLEAAYGALERAVGAVDEEGSWTPTGCTGWAVRDLVFHLVADAQRALVALHTPAGDDPADRDAVSYWDAWQGDPNGDANGRRHARVGGAMFARWEQLQELYVETAAAARDAVRRADPTVRVRTQGHVITVADLASTLAVEATVHHLDLVAERDDLPAPTASGLAEARRVVEAIAGAFPADWPDDRVVLLGTGRATPDPTEQPALTAVLPHLPAFA